MTAAGVRVLVVADDLTGANATGASFARHGLRTLTVRGARDLSEHGGDVDVLVVDTDSRHLSAGEATERVRAVLDAAPAADLVVKRTDTTLRGNVGAESEAVLTWLRERDDSVRAVMVPAFPEAGRTTVGGLHLVDGVPLSLTEVARDPRAPVDHSRVTDLLRLQTDLAVAEVTLDTVIAGAETLSAALDSAADIVVVDAVDRSNLHDIAVAAAALAPPVRWCCIDPGPFGPELADALGLTGAGSSSAPLLVASGSATDATRAQLDAAERVLDARFVLLDPLGLPVDETVARIVDLASAHEDRRAVVGLRTVDADSEVVSLSAHEAAAVPAAIGRVVVAVLERTDIGGLYLTGGDVTLGVLDALDCHGIAVDQEVLPLAVAGRLAGGRHHGLPVVTKGGLIGGPTAAVTCLDELRSRATRARRDAATNASA